MKGWRRLVFLPDYQIPYHDKRTVSNLRNFVGDYQPDGLYHVGDLIDAPEPSRWNKGSAGEYAGTLQRSIDDTVEELTAIRNVYSGPFGVKRGNHDQRVQDYVRRFAPALDSLVSLDIRSLLRLDSLGIDWHHGLTDVAPGWVLAHGDEGSLSRVAGGTATSLAVRIGRSVVCGHTHKAALKSATYGPQGYNGRLAPTLWGMEVGNAMDHRKASYLKTGGANWQQGFGILYVKGRTVIPSLINIDPSGVFAVEGAVYGAK